MEAVPRLPMISCDIKVSPSNTDFGHTLRKYIRDFYHEDAESYTKEIKELEALRQNAIKAPMDFTGCSILKRYYSQLHKLQSRFPMTDDGPACVPFMWTDIYSGVAYNITDIEYEEACILYNIGALHSKLGTMDSRCNAEGMKIACTHFQCAAWAFQHLRDTFPQPKGSDMSHDLLTFFINIMLAQAQECILEKSMLDSRKSSITAKIAAQVVDYYKCALGIMVSGSPSTDTGSILDIVGSKIFKGWKKFIEFKMSYYASISHLYMGNQAEEHEKWGERVAWFQSANDHLTEAFKIAKSIDREDLNEPLAFTMDVIGGKLNSSKKENEFVYHDKVPALTSLPELKGASLVKGIPFSITDPDVSGPDIFARLVPMEAHETSSLYSEEKAKLLRSVVSKIEEKNEELMAYLSSLQLEGAISFEEEEKIPQELLEKCASMSVRPSAISDLEELMKELMSVSKDVDSALKSSFAFLMEEEQKELKHQEVFGKRSPSLLIMELKKECSKYDEAHKKAVESNNTLETVVHVHTSNMSKLLLPLEEIAEMLPSVNSVKTPENVKAMEDFNHLINKVEEMKNQRIYLEQQLRDALLKDDITTDLVTLKKKEDLQKIFDEELKKHAEITTFIDQNLTAQDNILYALTEANARYAETRKVINQIQKQRLEMVHVLASSHDSYDDVISKVKKGLEFYQKLQTNVNRLLTRIRGVTKVQEEERAQIAEVRNGPRIAKNPPFPSEPHVPKLKDYLPYLSKDGGRGVTPLIPPGSLDVYAPHQIPPAQIPPEPMRQATLGGPATDFNRKLKPSHGESIPSKDKLEAQSIGIRPTPVGSEQPSVSTMCVTTIANTDVGSFSHSTPQIFHPYLNSGYASQIHYPQGNLATASSHVKPLPPAFPSNNSMKIQNTVYNNEMVVSGAITDHNREIPYQMPSKIAAMPQHCTSLSAIPSIPSQVNSSYMPTVPACLSSFTSSNAVHNSMLHYANNPTPNTSCRPDARPYSSSGPLSFIPASEGTSSFVPASSAVSNAQQLPVSHVSPHGTMQYSTIASASHNIVPSTTNSSLSSIGTSTFTAMTSSGAPNSVAGYQNKQELLHQDQPIIFRAVGGFPYYDPRHLYNGYIPLSVESNLMPNTSTHDVGKSTTQNFSTNSLNYGQTVYYGQNVNASMDTRTSTFNTSNRYPLSSPNAAYQPNVIYPNQPENRNPANTNLAVSALNSNTQNYASAFRVENYSVNNTVPASSGIVHNVTTVPSAPSNYQMDSTQIYSQNSQSMQPFNVYTANICHAISSQTTLTDITNDSICSRLPITSTDGNYGSFQSPTNTANQYNYGVVNVLPSSNISPNQPIQVPEEPKVQASNQPLQPSFTRVEQEIKFSTDQKSKVETIQAIRDLITPPLEPESVKDSVKGSESALPPVLQPKVLDLKEITQLKEKDTAHLLKDPLDDPAVCSKFVSEVEKYEKFVDGLVRKSLNGTTPLDQKWKELIDAQDKESRKLSISVARCYPLKNRFPDVMPYDNNRVKLTSAKDDYINASYLKDICPGSPVFVISQSPLPSTFNDFWLMVWEQQVETLICLLSDTELKHHLYFPREVKKHIMLFGVFEISLHSYKEKNGFVERMVNITHTKNRTSRVVVHLQFTQWPVSGTPNSPAPLLQFIFDVLSYQKQQRNLMRPVVVHCSSGTGRSGCFCLITALVNEMNNGHGPRDVAQVATMVSQQRKFLIQDKDQLKFCYDTVLYYAQDLLMKRGILTSKASFDDKLPGSGSTSSHVRHPSEDFILGSGGLAKLQSGIESMSVASDSKEINGVEIPSETLNIDIQMVGNGDPPTSPVTNEDSKGPSEDKSKKDDKQYSLETSIDSTAAEIKVIPSITSLLDPSNFSLDSTGSPVKRKITKENFANSKGSLSTSSSDSADPLSQLDPLWSLKKQ